MFTSYLKITWRNLCLNPTYSFINIAGLSIGIAASLLIILWVVDEISWDRSHANIDNLYTVRESGDIGNEIDTWDQTAWIVYEDLKTSRTEFKYISASTENKSYLISHGEKRTNEKGRFVTEHFLEMFQFPLLKGTASAALAKPNSVVITSSMAHTLFGTDDPMNRELSINNGAIVTVTGILKDLPDNSSFDFRYLMTFDLVERVEPWATKCMNDSDCQFVEIYGEVNDGANVEALNLDIKDVLKKHTEWLNPKIFLYPMSRYHLHDRFENGTESSDDLQDNVWAFSAIALGILVIVCVNFMNLSTARAERRAKEVGVRKITGSRRKDLVVQFLLESTVVVLISFLLAVLLAQLLLPLYNMLIEKNLSINYRSTLFWAFSILLVVVLGLFSGSYPAFYLSSFKPATVLKGALYIGTRSVMPRRLLVIVQFVFSMVLLISTIVIYQQFSFSNNREIGYHRDNLITIPNNNGLKETYHTIKQKLSESGLVIASTKSNSPITQVYESNFLFLTDNHNDKISIVNIYAEYDYLKTMGVPLIEGRDFSENMISDTSAVILNESAVELLGIKNPLGSKVNVAGRTLELIGICKDVVMDSPYDPIEPLYIVLETEWSRQDTPQNITIRIPESSDLSATLVEIEKIFKTYNPQFPFEYTFASADYDKKFHSITVILRLVNVFALIAIIIACLGLFGLAAFMAERRTKEFGIRKVLGAGVSNLIMLMSRDFIRLITTAFCISAPIAWLILTDFLERYTYHIDFDWMVVSIAGMSVLLLALLIVGTQAMKVAATNPVDSLHGE